MHIKFDPGSPKKELNSVRKKAASISVARLIVFLMLGAVIIVGLSELRWLLVFFFPISFLFIYLIIIFNRQKDKEAFLQAVVQIYEDREKRKVRDLSSFDKGAEFQNKKHPFSNDLDLFGDHSLFQLINHTVSAGGRANLSQWMLADTSATLAQKRYPAVEELSSKRDFLLYFEAYGKAFLKEEKSKRKFFQWLTTASIWKSWFIIPAIAGPLIGGLVLGLVLFGYLTASVLSLFVLIGMVLLGQIFKPLMHISQLMPNAGDLKTLTAWALQLEAENFSNDYLQELKNQVSNGKHKASEALKSLEQQTFMVQNHTNMMYLIFNLLFWIDFPVLMRLEKWKSKYGAQIQHWEEIFNEWQTLVSLGTFTADEMLKCDTSWSSELTMEVEDIKHPLIAPASCVGNDFSLYVSKNTVLLTGSNMSGKTTFMRTLGINIVLANLGLNPFAKKFQMGPFLLFTSMRNTDNLGENVSSFYAELARIRELLLQAEKSRSVFFLLDEILKGTNTTDRIMGSEALIRQLSYSNCKGIISTHDIELSELENRLPSLLNHSFHSEIRENEILFDYKIKSGPCPSFNAHKLMELMGIKFN